MLKGDGDGSIGGMYSDPKNVPHPTLNCSGDGGVHRVSDPDKNFQKAAYLRGEISRTLEMQCRVSTHVILRVIWVRQVPFKVLGLWRVGRKMGIYYIVVLESPAMSTISGGEFPNLS